MLYQKKKLDKCHIGVPTFLVKLWKRLHRIEPTFGGGDTRYRVILDGLIVYKIRR